MGFIETCRVASDTKRCSPADTVLVVLCKVPDAPSEGLSGPPALPAEAGGADFCARMVAEIEPVDVEADVVVQVHHLVRQRVLGVRARQEPVLAQQDPVVGGEAARLEFAARETPDDVPRYGAGAERLDVRR